MSSNGPATNATASGSASRELPALQQMRESVQELLRQGKVQEGCEMLLSALEAVLRKSHELELLIAKLQRVGRSSERIDPAQLQLLFEELLQASGAASSPDWEAEGKEDTALQREIAAAEARSLAVKHPRRPAGSALRTHGVERQSHEEVLGEEQRHCPRCGRPMKPMGHDITHRLEYVPGHFIEHEYRLQKYGCGTCKEEIKTAPAPPRKCSIAAPRMRRCLPTSSLASTPITPRCIDCIGFTLAVVQRSRSLRCATGRRGSRSWSSPWWSSCTSGS